MHQDEPSLFDHLSQVRKDTFAEGGVTMVIYCGKILNESDMTEVLSVHRKVYFHLINVICEVWCQIVEDEVNNEECNVTGILIGQGNCIIHLLEGPCYSVLNILRSLSEHSHFNSNPKIQTGRIIYNVEDRPIRYYPEWYSCIIQEKRSVSDEVDENTAKDVVDDLSRGMIEVGKKLINNSNGNMELNRYASNLPGKNLILALTNSEVFFSLGVSEVALALEWRHAYTYMNIYLHNLIHLIYVKQASAITDILTVYPNLHAALQEFVEFYADSYHAELESERCYPVEPLVRY